MSRPRPWHLALIVIATALMVFLTDAWAAKQAETYKQLDLLVEIRHELVENYVEAPDQLELVEAAVQGMVDSLEDPYTVFVPAEHVEQFSDRLTGSFSGIGAQIEMHEGRPRINTPLEDSPAWEAGVMAGDVILEVDGVTTQDQDQMEVIKRIKGEAGTDVVLKVRRATGEELDITITRAEIKVKTVRGARRTADQSFDFMLDHTNKIGYVRLSQFTDKTVEELRDALNELKGQGVEGLILDVRFDPGGLLESAWKVSDMFLTGGQRIVSTKGRKWKGEVFDSTDDTIMPDTPLVVLANEASASASEVVTGALSDNGRALFVGTRTFGKGSVQQVRGLESGLGALKLTGAYYYLPSGRNIHKKPDAEVWGVDPDEGAYVPMTFEQYEKMITVRREADTIRADNGNDVTETITPEYIEDELHDLQLAAALRAVLGKLDTGKWPKVGLENAEELVKLRERQQLERRRNLLLEELERVEAELEEGQEADVEDVEAVEPEAKADEAEAENMTEEVNEESIEVEEAPAVEDAAAEQAETVIPEPAEPKAEAPKPVEAADEEPAVIETEVEAPKVDEPGTDASPANEAEPADTPEPVTQP